MNKYLRASLTFFLLSIFAGSANSAPISAADIVANWSAERDPVTNSTNAIWSQSGSSVYNGGNRTGALVSDTSTTGDFTFSTTLRASGDNDLMGLVFGWQDTDNTYFLGWGGGGVGSAWNGIQLTRFLSNSATDLASQAGNWTSGVNYLFTVGRSGNDIFASISQGATSIFSTSLTDTNFMSGNFGFQTWSQSAFFSASDATLTTVPEPATLALVGLALLAASRRRIPD